MRDYLIVDDNQALAENFAEILTDAGEKVDLAASGSEALVRVATRRYDALISDMRMPEMSGDELVQRARAIDPGLPIVVITAYTSDEVLRTVRRAGLHAVLSKPTSVRELLEILGNARRDRIVVVVDRNVASTRALSEALQRQGYAVVAVRDACEAEGLGWIHPFAVFVDLHGVSGTDRTMARLRDRFSKPPILRVIGDPELSLSELLSTAERHHQGRDSGRAEAR